MNAIGIVDTLLEDPQVKPSVKEFFGLKDLKHDDDFASVLSVSYCVLLEHASNGYWRIDPPWVLAGQELGSCCRRYYVRQVLYINGRTDS